MSHEKGLTNLHESSGKRAGLINSLVSHVRCDTIYVRIVDTTLQDVNDKDAIPHTVRVYVLNTPQAS